MKPEDIAKLPEEAQAYIKALEAKAASRLAFLSSPTIARHLVQILVLGTFVLGMVVGHLIF